MIFSLLHSQLSVQGYADTTCYKVPNEQPRPMCRASFCDIFGQACCSHILCVLHSPGIFHTSCTTLTSSDVRYCLNHICPQCLILCCRITIIIIIIIVIIIIAQSSPVLFLGILSHVSATIPQLEDIALSARYGQYQGWLTIVRFQKYLVDSTSYKRPLHSPI